MTQKEIVMYSRRAYCPAVALARDLLRRYAIPFREIDIGHDGAAAARLKTWTGHHSVPTLIIAEGGADVPFTDISPLPANQPLSGVDRGPLITEPNNRQLEDWLHKHGFRDKPYQR